MTEQEEMMNLLEQQQTEIENLTKQNKELNQTIEEKSNKITELIGENQLLKERVVMQSKSDLELKESQRLNEESKKMKEESQTIQNQTIEQIRENERETQREWQKITEKEHRQNQREQAIIDKEKNIDKEIASHKTKLDEKNKSELQTMKFQANIKNNAITYGILILTFILAILQIKDHFSSYHIIKTKEFFINIGRFIKKILFDAYVCIIKLGTTEIPDVSDRTRLIIKIVFAILYTAILVGIVFVIIKTINWYKKQIKPILERDKMPLRLFIILIISEYFIFFNFAEKTPINYNYIFIIFVLITLIAISYYQIKNNRYSNYSW